MKFFTSNFDSSEMENFRQFYLKSRQLLVFKEIFLNSILITASLQYYLIFFFGPLRMSNYFFTASVNYSENKKCFKTRVYSCNERTRKKKKKSPLKTK